MALTTAQKVSVAEVVYETYATVNRLASYLITEQETFIIERLAAFTAVRDSHVRLDGGGSDAINFDNERKREPIRKAIRKALGLPLVSGEVSNSGCSKAIPNEVIW
jgi:hypothetical protein